LSAETLEEMGNWDVDHVRKVTARRRGGIERRPD
jgi:hypothetical protein